MEAEMLSKFIFVCWIEAHRKSKLLKVKMNSSVVVSQLMPKTVLCFTLMCGDVASK